MLARVRSKKKSGLQNTLYWFDFGLKILILVIGFVYWGPLKSEIKFWSRKSDLGEVDLVLLDDGSSVYKMVHSKVPEMKSSRQSRGFIADVFPLPSTYFAKLSTVEVLGK